MRRKVRRMSAFMGVLILLWNLSGCSEAEHAQPQGAAAHEVLTLKPVDQDKMMITLRTASGIQAEEMEKGIEAQFPEVDIVVTNPVWLQKDLSKNCSQDIILTANTVDVNRDASKKFIDLSGESFTQNYYLSSMRDSASQDGLFYLPGPSNIYGLVYNKDMFEKYGWEVPETQDEFIALCKTIEAQGIRAIQPALYYRDAVRQFFTGFTYESVLAGLENNIWYQNYRAGTTSMIGHMEPAFSVMQRFLDAGILKAGDFDVKPQARTNMMYKEQRCAMILETQEAVNYCTRYGGENAPDIGMLPFFSGNGPDSDYLLSVPNYYMAVNKELEQPGNEEKLYKVMEILGFLSTVEGQKAVTSEKSTMISSIRGSEWTYNDFLDGVKDTIEKGNVVRQPFFVGESNTEVDMMLKDDMALFARGDITAEEVMRDLDQARDRALADEDSHSDAEVIGRAEETFTILQTAQLFADIFRERADTQIGLCKANTNYQGCFYRIYQGEITFGGEPADTLEYYIKEGFNGTGDEEQVEKLTRVTMTGDDLVKTLNTVYSPVKLYPDAYWAASGLKITFAPWKKEGSRIVSVTLSDGTAIDPNAEYTVAVWSNSIDPKRITETEAYYDEPAEELFRTRVETQGSIKPELDAYFILQWDM